MDSPAVAPVLVGRDDELAVLTAARESNGRVCIVSGVAGVGKSRLVREVEVALGGEGTVLVGRASAAAATAPLRPLREAMLAAARHGIGPPNTADSFTAALAVLVPEWGPTPPQLPDPALLGEAIVRLLSPPATSAPPPVLVIEDLQWADAETVAVVEYIADHVADSGALLILTVRTGEAGAGADLARDLLRRRVAIDVQLGPLAATDVVDLATACAGGDLPAEIVDVLIDRSEGIPFIVEELVAAAIRSGWDTVQAAVPGSIVAAVETRLNEMDDDAVALIVAAGLLGRSFDWRVAVAVSGLQERAATRYLRRAVRAQLLESTPSGFRFRHALTRDAVVAVAAASDRERLAHAALAHLSTIADRDVTTEQCLVAADLAGIVGDRRRAGRFLEMAARRAFAAGALRSASDYADRAAEVTQASSESVSDAGLGSIDVLQLEIAVTAGSTERAHRIGERLLGDQLDASTRADVHLLIAAADLAAGLWEEAGAHAEAACALVPADQARAARADAVTAQATMGADDVDRAVEVARRALAAARTTGQHEVQCACFEVLGRAARGRDTAEAEAAFSSALDVATRADLPVWRARALHELGTIDLFESLDPRRLLRAREQAAALGAIATVAVIDLQLAALYDERGELEAALDWARSSERASRQFDLSTLPMSLVLQAMVHARWGRRRQMEDAIAAARATEADVDYVESGIAGQALGVWHLLHGDLQAAAVELDRAMSVIRQRPAAALPYPGLWALVRTVIDDGGDAARREVASLPFDTPVSRRALDAAEAVALGRRGEVEAAAHLFGTSDDWLTATHGRFRRALHRILISPDAGRDGWADVGALLREALADLESLELDALAARCRAVMREVGAPVPRRRERSRLRLPPRLARLGITEREVEVLVLVSTGATNRQIAEELFISRRTVDKHVERILAKTGVSRGELATIAGDAGLRT